MSDFKFPVETIDLPSGGKLYPEGHPLRSGRIDVKYMTAKEEDILTSTKLIQKGQVQVYYMLCADTIDEYMRDILKEKQQVADLVVDGALVTPERSKSYFKEFVSKINSVYNQDISTKNIED